MRCEDVVSKRFVVVLDENARRSIFDRFKNAANREIVRRVVRSEQGVADVDVHRAARADEQKGAEQRELGREAHARKANGITFQRDTQCHARFR